MHFLSNFKDDAVKSVLHISSAHNIGVPTDISIAQIFYGTFWNEMSSLYSFASIANQKSVRYLVGNWYSSSSKCKLYITDFTDL
jgi:hypothetical protein